MDLNSVETQYFPINSYHYILRTISDMSLELSTFLAFMKVTTAETYIVGVDSPLTRLDISFAILTPKTFGILLN